MLFNTSFETVYNTIAEILYGVALRQPALILKRAQMTHKKTRQHYHVPARNSVKTTSC